MGRKETSSLLQNTRRGIYCARGDFYIDPTSKVRTALITHAHSDHARPGHGEYHCAEGSAGLLRARLGGRARIQGHRYSEVIRFGDVDVSFHSAGHILGSAQIRVATESETWVVSGDYKRDPDPSCAPFEVVPCDTFITEATFALPIYRWESGKAIAAQVFGWWEKNRALGRASILLCYSLGKAQRILAELMAFTDREILTHGSVEELVKCYREEGVALLPTREIAETDGERQFAGQLLLIPPSATSASWLERLGSHETAFASGWMRTRQDLKRRGGGRGFVLSDHADWPGLVETVRQTGASKVYVTHGFSDILVRHLVERGVNAAPLEALGGGGETE